MLSTFSVNAQIFIKGKITDNNGEILSGCTVALLKENDSTILKFSITNNDGMYAFDHLAYNSYKLRVSHINYLDFISSPIRLSKDLVSSTVKNIILQKAIHSLGSVKIISKKPFIELKLDRTILNVESEVTGAGSNTLELLEKSPNISIDKDGGIMIKGKQGVIVLMDGKSISLKGQDLSDFLRNLPSSQLDQLEIITQPSAKYDASGTAGVINLKSKRNKQKGFNGSLSIGYMQTYYPRSSNNLNLNFRNKNISVFLTYSYSYFRSYNDLTIRHIVKNNQNQHYILFDQFNKSKAISQPHNIQTELDYSITPKIIIGAGIAGQIDSKRNIEVGGVSKQLDIDLNNTLIATNISKTLNLYNWRNMNINMYVKNQLTSKREISLEGNYLKYNKEYHQTSDNYLFDNNGNLINSPDQINPYLTTGNLPSLIKIYSVKADYSDMLNAHTKIETGWKSSFIKTDNNAQYEYFENGNWKNNEKESNHFLYKEYINGAYLNLQNNYKKFNIEFGVRAEQTLTNAIQIVKQERHDTTYINLFPSASIKFSPNENHQISFSYNKRVDRPSYPDMNPFRYFFDKYTYLQGNPFLLPQISHSLELGYRFNSNLTLNLNYTQTHQVISEILKQTDSIGILYQTKENLKKLRYCGFSISYYKELTKWFSLSVSGNVFNNRYLGLVNGSYLNTNRTAATFNLTSQFQFHKSWKAEVTGYYNTLTYYNALTSLFEQKTFSIGASKSVLNNKGVVKLNIKDSFALLSNGGDTRYGNVNHYVFLKWNNRGIGFTFSYRFGNSKVSVSSRRKDSTEDEKKRIN